MKAPLSAILDRLEALVACDTQNPPRALTPEHAVAMRVREALPDFSLRISDLGEGSLNLLAVRGAPKTLINVHLDTVPADPGWDRDPFGLERLEDRAVGLGACDIKGAAACAIEAARHTGGPAAFLFTTDEEHGKGRCVRAFLETEHGFERVVVAEPTSAQAVLAHRGVMSLRLGFRGEAGHASQAGTKSAVHAAADWIQRARALDERYRAKGGANPGLRVNAGRIEGGIKANVVASECQVLAGLRPGPALEPAVLVDELKGLAPRDVLESCELAFHGPALAERAEMRALAENAGISVADPVDFWTEAALFGAGGVPAMVLGPGHISQAHTAGEWVSYAHLSAAFAAYSRLLEAS